MIAQQASHPTTTTCQPGEKITMSTTTARQMLDTATPTSHAQDSRGDEAPSQGIRSQRKASLTAGIALALLAVLSVFGNFIAINPLVTPGDAAKTAQNILASETMFRWGIASLILVAIGDIIVASALLTLFRPVNRGVSTAAAWFRAAYAAVYLTGISQLLIAITVLADPNQASRAIEAFNTIWQTSLILFAVHLLLEGYLAYRSGFMPKVFGILLAVAGLGYLADGFGAVLISGYSFGIGRFTFVGEVALILWLLIKGTRMTDVKAATSAR
jgi:hypothetical protein